jgi:hypothetical protein
LQLAPGGHSGRLIVWSESAFNQLNAIFGTRKEASKIKKGFQPPRSVLTNCDISRIINSPEIQSQLRLKKTVCSLLFIAFFTLLLLIVLYCIFFDFFMLFHFWLGFFFTFVLLLFSSDLSLC